jgi:hypothetical protein
MYFVHSHIDCALLFEHVRQAAKWLLSLQKVGSLVLVIAGEAKKGFK